MEPLKRFTQCGSLTMLFGVFLILFGVSSTALTTFGKTNNQPPATYSPIVKARECNTHDDCITIDKSSCVRSPEDFKYRCLCGDDSVPKNNLCSNFQKGLRHKCTAQEECEENLVCQFENANRTIGVAKFISTKVKMCLCDNESGYFEDVEHDICSGGNAFSLINTKGNNPMLQTVTSIVLTLLLHFIGFN